LSDVEWIILKLKLFRIIDMTHKMGPIELMKSQKSTIELM